MREFVMKDSYSFDLDEAGLDKSFELNREAYLKIFERCGLETFLVLAESGIMGGSESYDFLAPAGSGGNTLVTCENGDYAADLEIAQGIPRAPDFPPPLDAPEEIETPDVTTIEALATLLAVDEAATSKAMPHTKNDGTVVLALVRGDDRLEEAKLLAAVGADVRPSTEDEIKAAFGADPGSLGPVGFKGEVIADETLREGQFVAGANRTGWHLKGVEHGRDFEARFADLRVPKEGDRCPLCGGALQFQTAIEVGHIFKLGTKFSEPFGATVLDEDGNERLLVMGSYGIGPGRVMAAAIEQHHDDERDHLAARDRALRRARRRRSPGAEEIATSRRRQRSRTRARRPARRPRRARRREIRRRRPDRLPDPCHGRQEEPRGRQGRRQEPGHRRGAAVRRCRSRQRSSLDGAAQAVQRGGVRPDDRGAHGRVGGHLPRARRPHRPLRRLSQPSRARQPAGPVERRRARRSPKALGVEAEHFREFRLRVITDRLEAMPDLIDRLYKRLGD